MPPKVFVDTSAWIAYSLKGEPKHEIIRKLIKESIEKGSILTTSGDVVDETITRLVYDTNLTIAQKFFEFISQATRDSRLVQLWTDEETQKEAAGVLEKFCDHKLSFTDATSVVFIKRFGIQKIITLDSDFAKIGLRSLP